MGNISRGILAAIVSVILLSLVVIAGAMLGKINKAIAPNTSIKNTTENAADNQSGDAVSDKTPDLTTEESVADIGDVSVPTSLPDELNKLGFAPAYSESAVTLDNAYNWKAVSQAYGIKLTAAEINYLNKYKFLLYPLSRANQTLNSTYNDDEMLFALDQVGGDNAASARKPENAKFITPDAVLHAYHKFFELTLEELEKHQLRATLNNFLTDLYGNVYSAAQSNADLKDNYQALLSELSVARVLLDNHLAARDYFTSPETEQYYNQNDASYDSGQNALTIFKKNYAAALDSDWQKKVEEELGLIYEAKNFAVSPIFSRYTIQQSDYTQYTPRSHYTKSSALRSYFRTMMYLGRSSFFLSNDVGWQDTNLLTQQFVVQTKNKRTPFDSWQKMMKVTGFYAGQSDDLTYVEWQKFLQDTLGTTHLMPAQLVSADTIQKLKNNFAALRLPKILSDKVVDPNMASLTKLDLLRGSLSYRIFGQRFTYDAWILNDLTKGQESGPPLPSMPTAVFVPAALGDSYAQKIVGQYLTNLGFTADKLSGFNVELAKKQTQMSALRPVDWFGSLSSAWVYVLSALGGNYGPGYPAYMQALPFVDKQLQTFLGSYTELKHDTVLYAKQSYAEMGGGPDDRPLKPIVRGFVEPNVIFWRKLLYLIDYTESVFKDGNLLPDHQARGRLDQFRDQVEFYTELAEKELKGEKITEAEYEKLRNYDLIFIAEPFAERELSDDSGKVELVTDIHTDVLSNKILYEATGRPYLMLALVGDNQNPRLVIGVAYNHFEFQKTIGPRLTDEEWKAQVFTSPAAVPGKNFWYNSLSPASK